MVVRPLRIGDRGMKLAAHGQNAGVRSARNPIEGVDLPATLLWPEMIPAMITPWYPRQRAFGYQSGRVRPDLSVAAGPSRVGECGRFLA